jgi:hypothetical protein
MCCSRTGTLPAAALITAMRKAVEAGVLDPQVVLIAARRTGTSLR